MLLGEKIYLRPIVRSDLAKLNKWRNNAEIFKYLGTGFVPVSVDQQEKWLDSMIDLLGVNRRFIICDHQEKPVGMVGLYDINWIHQTCEIGIFIGETEAQGHGFGKDACTVIESYAKGFLNIRKIKLYVVRDNGPAYGLWRSLGYQDAGVLARERYIDGVYHDVVIMEKFL